LLQPERIHACVDRIRCNDIKEQVCGGVIAHYNHDVDCVAQGKPQTVVKFEEDTGTADLFFFCQHQLIVPFHFAVVYLRENLNHDRDLDGARRPHTFVFSDSIALPGSRFWQRDGSFP
jgi:hypothetical protein